MKYDLHARKYHVEHDHLSQRYNAWSTIPKLVRARLRHEFGGMSKMAFLTSIS